MDPKRAKRILANRLSAAKSKLKQKSREQVLWACGLLSKLPVACPYQQLGMAGLLLAGHGGGQGQHGPASSPRCGPVPSQCLPMELVALCAGRCPGSSSLKQRGWGQPYCIGALAAAVQSSVAGSSPIAWTCSILLHDALWAAGGATLNQAVDPQACPPRAF
jgi:hypothetical protein